MNEYPQEVKFFSLASKTCTLYPKEVNYLFNKETFYRGIS